MEPTWDDIPDRPLNEAITGLLRSILETQQADKTVPQPVLNAAIILSKVWSGHELNRDEAYLATTDADA